MSKSLDGILNKLSHHLPEVRCRALRSLISKLDHGLIHESDLVPERSFIVKFLEWFNFDTTPMSEDVLQLLKRLSGYENARFVLLSLGAVEFLSKLRNDVVGTSLRDTDAILKNLTAPNGNRNDDNVEPIARTTHDSRFFSSSSNTVAPDNMAANYLAFPGFPWHFLTATDRHVLSSTSTSLSSSDPALVENACLFLLDVVLHDFPAEIFLQRPTIINTLLILLRSGADVSVICVACKCLSLIARNLTVRILTYQDPDFHCPRQGLPGYYNSIKELTSHYDDSAQNGLDDWERNGGDGRDGAISSSLSSEYDGSLQIGERSTNTHPHFSEDEPSLVAHSSSLDDDSFLSSQLSALEFTFSCLQAIADLLSVDSPIVFFDAYEVACSCVQVLSHLFNIKALWSEDQGICDGVRTRIKLLSGIISRCVLYHSHMKCDPESEAWETRQARNTKDAIFHRIAFQVCCVLFLRFLESIIAEDRIVYLSSVNSIEKLLFMIASDQAFKMGSPDLHDLAVGYLTHFESRLQHEKLQIILESIQCIHDFKEISGQQGDYKSLLMKAEGSLDALPYYNPEGYVTQVVDLVSMVKPSYGEFHCQKAKLILQRLLSHCDLKVRSQTYVASRKVIMKLFENLDDSSIPNSCYFMINNEVIQEVMMNGLASDSSSVKNAANDIIISLMRGRYFMDDKLWNDFLHEINSHLPALQSFAGESDVLTKVIIDFVSTNFDHLSKLVCLIRFLVMKSRKVRSFASPLLREFLLSSGKDIISSCEDYDGMEGLMRCLCQMDDFTDRLVVNEPVPALGSKTSLRSLAVNEELMLQMLSVLRSKDTSKAKRLATFQQMACMLSVKESHDVFLKSDGLLTIKRHLCHISSNSVLTKHENEIATSCILIMLKVSLNSDGVRKALLQLPTILSLLRFLVLSHNFSETSNLAAQVLTILILNGVIKTQCEITEELVAPSIRLPSRIISHYHIALSCSPQDVISLRHSLDIGNRKSNSHEMGPFSFAIALKIVMVQNGGSVCVAVRNLKSETNILTSEGSDALLRYVTLLCSNPDAYLDEFAPSVSNAKMHATVSRDLCLLRTLLLTYPSDYLKALIISKEWRSALETFILVHPSSTDDIKLLCDVVTLLSDVVKAVPSSHLSSLSSNEAFEAGLQSTLVWYTHIICGSLTSPDMPLLDQLKNPSMKSEQLGGLSPRAKEQRRLCKTIMSMMSHMSAMILVLSDKSVIHKFQSTLCRIILFRLKLANTPRYYDLPSMEVMLDCLLHNTAACAAQNRSAEFFYDDNAMPVQLMSSLFEVVSAFHIENSGSNMSYMGRGVSKSATQNIVNIVFGGANHGSKDLSTPINWLDLVSQGLLSGKYAAAKHKRSYKWILALWPARDPLIRYFGLMLTSLITSAQSSCGMMQEYFRDYPGGIWRVLLSVLFDSTECSAVRTEAAYVCCNLVLHSAKSDKNLMAADDFAKILTQYGFSQGTSHILSHYYPCSWIKPSSLLLYPHMYPVEITSSYATDGIPGNERSHNTGSRSSFGASSEASEFPPEWEASVSPNLVASLCHLLSNIFSCFSDLNVIHRHADIVSSIAYLIDTELLETAIFKFNSSDNINISKGRLEFLIKSLVRFFSESCKMLHVYLAKDSSANMLESIIHRGNVISNIISLATSMVAFAFDDWLMVRNAMDLLSYIIVNCSSSQDLEMVRNSLMNEWSRCCQCVKHMILSNGHNVPLMVSCVTFLTNLVSLVNISNETDREVLCADNIPDLCEASVNLYKSFVKSKRQGTFDCLLKCSYALQALFAFHQCKMNALRSGFLEYLIEEINWRVTSLSKQCQSNFKGNVNKGKYPAKRNAILLMMLRVLSSVLALGTEVQLSSSELGLNRSLQSMWKLMSGVSELRSTLVKVAICYTASCEETSTSLASCPSGKECFMSYIISGAQDMTRRILNNDKVSLRDFKDIFRLLCNLTISKECRSMLWKGAFLSGFPATADKGRHPRCTKQQHVLLQQWLRLMHNVSFFPDGQLNILKIQDVLVVLHGIHAETEHSDAVFKILANMCYHAPSKARISSNTDMVNIISSGLTNGTCNQAISALRALLCGCQKSKVFLKDARLSEKILNSQDVDLAQPDFKMQATSLLKLLEE